MTRTELIAALERLARQTLDRAEVEDSVAGTFQGLYETLRTQRPATDVAHQRLLELDPYVNGSRRLAEQLREDVVVLREAIATLGDTS